MSHVKFIPLNSISHTARGRSGFSYPDYTELFCMKVKSLLCAPFQPILRCSPVSDFLSVIASTPEAIFLSPDRIDSLESTGS